MVGINCFAVIVFTFLFFSTEETGKACSIFWAVTAVEKGRVGPYLSSSSSQQGLASNRSTGLLWKYTSVWYMLSWGDKPFLIEYLSDSGGKQRLSGHHLQCVGRCHRRSCLQHRFSWMTRILVIKVFHPRQTSRNPCSRVVFLLV